MVSSVSTSCYVVLFSYQYLKLFFQVHNQHSLFQPNRCPFCFFSLCLCIKTTIPSSTPDGLCFFHFWWVSQLACYSSCSQLAFTSPLSLWSFYCLLTYHNDISILIFQMWICEQFFFECLCWNSCVRLGVSSKNKTVVFSAPGSVLPWDLLFIPPDHHPHPHTTGPVPHPHPDTPGPVPHPHLDTPGPVPHPNLDGPGPVPGATVSPGNWTLWLHALCSAHDCQGFDLIILLHK